MLKGTDDVTFGRLFVLLCHIWIRVTRLVQRQGSLVSTDLMPSPFFQHLDYQIAQELSALYRLYLT